MAQRLDAADADFDLALTALVERRRDAEDDVRDRVAEIIARVRAEGDAALVDYTHRFDRRDLQPEDLRIGPERIAEATASCPPEQLEALRLAAARIRAFHERQLPEATAWADEQGVRLGLRWTPIDSVGLYVPGGTAAYPSSVLMNAIPARVAGCGRLVMTVPMPDGVLSPLVLAAAEIAGIDEIYGIGGAQAIAALAYGTSTILPVDKIMGPGNAYVAEAKRQVFGRVGIDMIAGPSEIVVVADEGADPAWVAADLLSQAEHDPRAQAVLVTDHRPLADEVEREVARQLQSLARAETAAASWRDEGAIVTVASLDDAIDIVDRLAPEHLELLVADPESWARRVRHAGAIFLGAHTPEVIGDYVGGPNHVLPTGRSARFASGLAVFDFLKRTTILGCNAESFAELAPAASVLARAEGLEAHALAVERRIAAAEPPA